MKNELNKTLFRLKKKANKNRVKRTKRKEIFILARKRQQARRWKRIVTGTQVRKECWKKYIKRRFNKGIK